MIELDQFTTVFKFIDVSSRNIHPVNPNIIQFNIIWMNSYLYFVLATSKHGKLCGLYGYKACLKIICMKCECMNIYKDLFASLWILVCIDFVFLLCLQQCFELNTVNNKVIKAAKTHGDGRVVEGRHTAYRMSATSEEEKKEWIHALQWVGHYGKDEALWEGWEELHVDRWTVIKAADLLRPHGDGLVTVAY